MTDKIRLSLKVKQYVLKLCERIKEKNEDNETAVTMADSMANVVKKYGSLSHGQIKWLCNNARLNKIKLLPELADLMNRGGEHQKATAENLSARKLTPMSDKMGRKIYKGIVRIERKLDEWLRG